MKKRNLRLVVSIVAVAGLVPAWACSSNNDTGTGTSGSTSSSGGTGGTGNGDSGSPSTGSPSTGAAASSTGGGTSTGVPIGDGGCTGFELALSPAPKAGPVLDDMSGQQSQTGGSWYTYSARTVPNSEPPILVVDSGTLSPPEGQSFLPMTGSTSCVPAFPYDMSGNFNFREFSGNAIPAWGAGFGFDLLDNLPDGGPVAFNMCDAGTIFDTRPDASNVGIPQPFNASQYAGFSFWGISLTSTALNVEVHVDDKDTDPWGGVCNACLNGGTKTAAGTPCSDNFIETVKFQPAVWKQYAVTFSDTTNFKVANWSLEGHLTFDPSAMYNIHFQITAPATKSTPAFDIAVADLQWIAK